MNKKREGRLARKVEQREIARYGDYSEDPLEKRRGVSFPRRGLDESRETRGQKGDASLLVAQNVSEIIRGCVKSRLALFVAIIGA